MRGSEGRGAGSSSATLNGGEKAAAAARLGKLEAAARLRKAGRRWQRGYGAMAGSRPQRGSVGRRGGSQPNRRVRRF